MAAAVYADHPFSLIPTPTYKLKQENPDYKPDLFDDTASEMALVHNMMIRGLNAIYLQAQHIKQSEQKDFCKFIINWHLLLHLHHGNEEDQIFPIIEKMAGVTGIMEVNVEQHHAFHDPLDKFIAYTNDVIAGKQKYDGAVVVASIDEFGPLLVTHLADEIPTLLALRQYGLEKMKGMPALLSQAAEHAMKGLGLSGLVCCFANLDSHFEDDMWLNFPPVPAPVRFLGRTLFWFLHRGMAKFGSSDRHSAIRALYAAGDVQPKVEVQTDDTKPDAAAKPEN
ncbi:hemerythrin HHE cation binding domain-containing protein [Lasiosphaeria miniovina]|uniref:Hemerythrin HHE cation binding domain-containing protein n=1 Tax=Lasiosphaeria miniovina TaxID=1954250 RepID=A0AA40AAR4_9PEZI|nr:hemerythrin HHE cation binding domain-containing protein [Lasiosphaeria miniovina]KAK0712359.1 hemerythrin HHE cation binding domain-containing protein [Lasiosphaeria miniovina]